MSIGVGMGTPLSMAGGLISTMLGLSRAKLSVYKPQLPGKTDTARSASPDFVPEWEIEFDYNPKEVTFERSAECTTVPVAGAAGAPQSQFHGPAASNREFELYYSRFEPTITGGPGMFEGLEEVSNKLFSLLEAHPESTEDGQTPTRPMVQFSWGHLVTNHCYVDKVSITFLAFMPTGEPLRMKATITLSEAPHDVKMTNPTSGGRTNRKTHTLLAGETLATVAFKELNDAGLWRAIAEVNDIDDPLRIASGSVLLMPIPSEV